MSLLLNLRVKAAAGLLIFFALLSSIKLLHRTASLYPEFPNRDQITLYEKRFEGLRKMLPPNGVVGYLSDKRAKDIRFDPSTWQYYLTQYALAPVIVAYSTKHKLIVGNFHGPAPRPEILLRENIILIRDFGNGVMLLRSE